MGRDQEQFQKDMSLKEKLRPKVRKVRDTLRRARMHVKAPLVHASELAKARRRSGPIRVAFMVSNAASWKARQIVEKMKDATDFEPLVFVCPVLQDGLFVSSHTEKLKAVLSATGMPFQDLSGLSENQAESAIAGFAPDLVFFTNPHRLTPSAFHDKLFKSKLSCYLPYSHEVSHYGGDTAQYNQAFHNWMWRIFVPHEVSRQTYAKARDRGARGVENTGYPCCEPLWSGRLKSPGNQSDVTRIIWAPHWALNDDLKWATVYELADDMQRVATEFEGRVRWVFRPHPLLRSAMEKRDGWGAARTSDFFDFWSNSAVSELVEGDYEEAFSSSSALIHDSGSFLAEYLYLDRPMMYLRTAATDGDQLNDFGTSCVAAAKVGGSYEDIRAFVDDVVSGHDPNSAERKKFVAKELAPSMDPSPSEKICDILRAELRKA